MKISVTATPIKIQAIDFLNDKGESVKFHKITFVEIDEDKQVIFTVNTQDSKFVEAVKASIMKEMKNIPLKVVPTTKGDYCKIKY